MGARHMTNLLILGTAITGLLMMGQAPSYPIPAFMATLGLINVATALFLAVVVRPMMYGKVASSQTWAHISLLLLIGSWAGAFWIEYFMMTGFPSALSGAITWTLAGLVYTTYLFVPTPEVAPQSTTTEPKETVHTA